MEAPRGELLDEARPDGLMDSSSPEIDRIGLISLAVVVSRGGEHVVCDDETDGYDGHRRKRALL